MTNFYNTYEEVLRRTCAGDRVLIKTKLLGGETATLRGVVRVEESHDPAIVKWFLDVGMAAPTYLGQVYKGEWYPSAGVQRITALERYGSDGKTLDKFPSPLGTYEITMTAAVVDTIQVEALDAKQAEKLAGKAFYAKHGTAPTTYTIYDRPE